MMHLIQQYVLDVAHVWLPVKMPQQCYLFQQKYPSLLFYPRGGSKQKRGSEQWLKKWMNLDSGTAQIPVHVKLNVRNRSNLQILPGLTENSIKPINGSCENYVH